MSSPEVLNGIRDQNWQKVQELTINAFLLISLENL